MSRWDTALPHGGRVVIRREYGQWVAVQWSPWTLSPRGDVLARGRTWAVVLDQVCRLLQARADRKSTVNLGSSVRRVRARPRGHR